MIVAAVFWFFMLLNLALGIYGLVMDYTQPIGYINFGMFLYMLYRWGKS